MELWNNRNFSFERKNAVQNFTIDSHVLMMLCKLCGWLVEKFEHRTKTAQWAINESLGFIPKGDTVSHFSSYISLCLVASTISLWSWALHRLMSTTCHRILGPFAEQSRGITLLCLILIGTKFNDWSTTRSNCVILDFFSKIHVKNCILEIVVSTRCPTTF